MKATSFGSKIHISKIAGSFISFALFLYFSFHLLHGDRGYFALQGLEKRLAEKTLAYESLTQERAALENRVKRLRPGSLDVDMLDERVRVILGYSKASEKIISD